VVSSEIRVQTVNHLGIIAGLIDEIGVATNTLHLDSSSFHVHGEYEAKATELSVVVDKATGVEQESGCESAPKPIHITHGYSRDKRADLKQFIIDLICSGDGDVPLYLRVADGNEADKAVFATLMREFRQQFCNVTNSTELTAELVLLEYKGQQSPERGFRFLKDSLFFTNSVFLKSPERVAAIAFVMGLCLLVYSLGQRALRACLVQAGETLDNQLGQPTQRPTLRWVFQCFQDVHLLQVAGAKQIANLTPERVRILRFLGSTCGRYYLLC